MSSMQRALRLSSVITLFPQLETVGTVEWGPQAIQLEQHLNSELQATSSTNKNEPAGDQSS